MNRNNVIVPVVMVEMVMVLVFCSAKGFLIVKSVYSVHSDAALDKNIKTTIH